MSQSVIPALCYEITEGNPAAWTGHFVHRLFTRTQPDFEDVLYLVCDDEPYILEDYPDDGRGRSCLIWGTVRGRVAHVVCSYPPGPAVITAYWPDPAEWTDNFRRRVWGVAMSCWRCGGRTESRRVRFCVSDLSPPVLVTNLPAEVCRQCGERTYSTRTLAALKRVCDGEGPNPQLGHLYVYDFDEIDRRAGERVGDLISLSPALVVTGRTDVSVPLIRQRIG